MRQWISHQGPSFSEFTANFEGRVVGKRLLLFSPLGMSVIVEESERYCVFADIAFYFAVALASIFYIRWFSIFLNEGVKFCFFIFGKTVGRHWLGHLPPEMKHLLTSFTGGYFLIALALVYWRFRFVPFRQAQ
ncbi:MAG: hypothetical protein GDA50_08605 [Alphaproteobacteria bacterium GM202ARS2]|nr:hypothetical protein [Alphaproteobacteria bacterium GM202ARS2]